MPNAGKSNIILVGMPGAGKSTVGVVLAKRTRRGFIDTDLLIQNDRHETLQRILEKQGYLALRDIEERVLLALQVSNHVVATGGSAVYSQEAMRHLKQAGVVVFLQTEMTVLLQRVNDFVTRGIAAKPGQSFEELFRERHELYLKHCDFIVDTAGKTVDQVAESIAQRIDVPLD